MSLIFIIYSLNVIIGPLVKKYIKLKGYSTQALAEKLSVLSGFSSYSTIQSVYLCLVSFDKFHNTLSICIYR